MTLKDHYKQRLEENLKAKIALGLGLLGGLQAGAMHNTEIPQIQDSSKTVETLGNATRTKTLARSAFAPKGEPTDNLKRGFFDVKDNRVTGVAQGLPSKRTFTASLRTPGNTNFASRVTTGGRGSRNSGNFSNTELPGPGEETVSRSTHLQQHTGR